MTVSPPQQEEAEKAQGFAAAELRPGVFLMMDTLETGGSERQFAALARSLDRRSFRVQVGCIQKRGPFLQGLGEVREYALGGNLYGASSLRTRWQLARDLRRDRITVAHAFDFYTNLTLIPAARWARVPLVIGSQRQIGDLLTWKQSWAQAAVLRWCDRIVCNSRAAADRLRRQGIQEHKLVVIGNGLPPEAFAVVPPLLPRRSGICRVVMIARMNTASKNHRLLLQAIARLRERLLGLEVLLAGDGPLRPELERQAHDLQLGESIRFLGDRRDISAVLASADLSVLPSASESLSNVILESMAAGVPVVASAVGGNPEIVTSEHGILVPPDDAQALADAIERLLRHPARREQLGRKAKQFASENFTLEQMRKRHEELYEALLAEKVRRPRFYPASEGSRPPLRIALVAASLRYVGGQSVQADLLLRGWENEPEVEAHLVPIDPGLPRFLEWVNRIPVLRTLAREPLYLGGLWRRLKDVEIAHIFSASYWSFLVAPAPAWLIARLRGKKTIIHYHSGEARDHLKRFRSARPVLQGADRLVVPSGYLVEVFREFGLSAEVVPNIVDLTQFSFRPRQLLRAHLLCTRGFHPYYDIDAVVRAFSEVQRTYPDARLDLVGDGPCEAQIRALAHELKLTNVNFAGVASRDQIGRFYDAADIFINASVLDNMPVSILEAFASGMPVVTTAPEGMKFLVEHERTGLLSPPGAWQALAENVIRLLRDDGLASRLACNAFQEMQRYCWPAVKKQWLEIYRSLAQPSAGSARRQI